MQRARPVGRPLVHGAAGTEEQVHYAMVALGNANVQRRHLDAVGHGDRVLAALALAPLNASSTAVRRMRVSSLVVTPRSTTVVAALSAADYYDGYLPPGLLVSTDGARSFGFERRLSNHNVVSLAVDARGRVCAATNGNGHQCVQINKDNFAEKSLSIVTS